MARAFRGGRHPRGNLILEPTGRWVFVDWDMAAPGSRLADLACAAKNFVPMFPELPGTWPVAHRLALLASAWELPVGQLMSAVVERARAETARFRELATSGREPWAQLW